MLLDLPVAHRSAKGPGPGRSIKGEPTHSVEKKCVGFAPHRQYIRGDAASNEATSEAKLRLAQQGRVGRDSPLLRAGQEGGLGHS